MLAPTVHAAKRFAARRRPPWFVPALLLTAGGLAACATNWSVATSASPAELRWPFGPKPAKVTFLRAFSGFARGRGAASLLRTIAVGEERREDPAGFLLPVAVATSADGRLAVADLGRRRVHVFRPERQQYFGLTGSRDEAFASPVAVVFDDESRLFVSDSAGAVFAFAPDGEPLFTLRSAGQEALRRPTGLAFSPRRRLLYVVDTLADRVHAFRTDGTHAFSFGQRGEGAGQLNRPTHIFWAPSGELFLADAMNFRVAIYDEAGSPLGSFGHHGDGSGDLAMPKGVAVDRDGVVYVADGRFDHLQLFDRTGRFLLTVGAGGTGFGEFALPSGVHLSARGELYVCDTYNRRIQVFKITERYESAE